MTEFFRMPGNFAISRATVIGRPVVSKRARVHILSAWARCAIMSMVAFRPIMSPNKVKATVTDRSVTPVRIGLRRSAAQMSGKYFMEYPSRDTPQGPGGNSSGFARHGQIGHRLQLRAGMDPT